MSKSKSAPEKSLEEMCRELLSVALRDDLISLTEGRTNPSELSCGDLVGMANRLSDLLHPKAGKWYIAFTWHNDFEPRGGVIKHEEIPLEATTEDAAIAEAHAIASSGKNVKTSCGEMPVPEDYSVIYKTR